MVTSVSAVDSVANAYAARITEVEETKKKKVTEPISFKPETDSTSAAATPEEVEQVRQAEEEYQEDKKNIFQKFADKMKKIFGSGEDIAKGAGIGALGGGVVGGVLGLLLKGGLKGLLRGGAAGVILGLLGIGALTLIGKLFGKDDKVQEKPEQPEQPAKPEPRTYEVKKGDNVWNIAKADLIEQHKDDPNYKVTNAEILARTNEIMEINQTVSDEDKANGFVALKWEDDHYHVMIRPGDKIKLDPKVEEEEVQRQLAVA